ncbi:peptide ABC transporter substrate-binding protein [Clostridium thailandense]|uniref:peptide ABC transporter substrate-binding protein n=1 Tax=Clostridium thailandense TaxID=2794346 RepID=UPI00398A508D
MKNKKNVLCLVMIFIIFSLVGCNKSSNKIHSEVKKTDLKQYLSIELEGEPKTLDQSKTSDSYSSQILYEVNEALTRSEVDENGKNIVKPAGAESWEVSSDRLKWTFHLRDNKWSDGKKVTAEDYEYGIKRNLDPEINSQNAFLLYPIKGARNFTESDKTVSKSEQIGIKAVDEKTLEIVLEAPCAYFLDLASYQVMQPQRKDLIEKFGNKYGKELNTMAFCGPFSISKWTHNKEIELIKNKSYWDNKAVKLEKVLVKLGGEDSLNSLLNGSIDLAKDVNLEYSKTIGKNEKVDIIKLPEPSVNFELYNQNNKLFSNSKIRKAFSLALDREEISKSLWKGVYTPAYGWIPPCIRIGDVYFRDKVNFEPIKSMKSEEAKKLLIEGLKELGMDGDPGKVTVNYLQSGTDIKQKDIADFFQKMYSKNLGVNIKVEYVDYDLFSKKIISGDYQMASVIWRGDYNDPSAYLNMWVKDTKLIPTGWSSDEYDSLIRKANTMGDNKNEDRIKNFKEAENILVAKEAVISPTVYRNKQILKREYVKNIMAPVFGPDIELKYVYTNGRE